VCPQNLYIEALPLGPHLTSIILKFNVKI